LNDKLIDHKKQNNVDKLDKSELIYDDEISDKIIFIKVEFNQILINKKHIINGSIEEKTVKEDIIYVKLSSSNIIEK